MTASAAETLASVERLVDAVLMAETLDVLGTPAESNRRGVTSVICEADDWINAVSAEFVAGLTIATGLDPSDPVLMRATRTASRVCGSVVADEMTAATALIHLLARTIAARNDCSVAQVFRDCLEPLRAVADDPKEAH